MVRFPYTSPIMSPELKAAQSYFWEWVALGLILPIAMIVGGWLLAALIGVPHPFVHTFGTAELLLVTVLFTIPVLLELDRAGDSDLPLFHKPLMLVFGVVIVFAYGALRAYTQKVSAWPSLPDEAVWLMAGVAALSIAVTIVGLIYASVVRYKVLEAQIANIRLRS